MKEVKEELRRIAELRQSDIGPSEENVKQKVVVPILKCLGHKIEDLDFESRTRRGGKIDIFIKSNVPSDCRVIVDTKNYDENLSSHIEQIKEYTFDEAALVTVIANGSEIRIYSPLRGIAFERSLLYSVKRQDLTKESVWAILGGLLHIKNLQSRSVMKLIDWRERQIKDVFSNEDVLKERYEEAVEGIESEIEKKEEEVEVLRRRRDSLDKEVRSKISELWRFLGLPIEVSEVPAAVSRMLRRSEMEGQAGRRRKRRVSLKELVDANLVREGETVYFYHTKVFEEEGADIVSSSNKVKYKSDGRVYSVSDLAKVLLIKHGFQYEKHGVAGHHYWVTERGELLNELNEKVRGLRGD